MTATTMAGRPRKRRITRSRVALHAFLITMSLIWIFPLAWAFFTALRPLADTITHGYLSWPEHLNFQNFIDGWTNANLGYYYLNTLIVAVPAVIIALLLASIVAFALTRVRPRINLFLLMMFTAGNLLPPQVIIVPLYRLYLAIPIPRVISDNGLLYDQYIGIILIHVVFQVGFCIFVLSNYMRTLPQGAQRGGPGRRRLDLPDLPERGPAALCAPALAALGTLEFTFIYNDFFWALLLMKPARNGRSPRPQQPAGPVLHELQHPGGRGPVGRDPHDHRVHRAPTAVHPGPDPGLDQGLGTRTGRQAQVETPPVRSTGATARWPSSTAKKSRERPAEEAGQQDRRDLPDPGVVAGHRVVVELAPVGDHALEPLDLGLQARTLAADFRFG